MIDGALVIALTLFVLITAVCVVLATKLANERLRRRESVSLPGTVEFLEPVRRCPDERIAAIEATVSELRAELLRLKG